MGGAGSVHRPHDMNVVPARGAAEVQLKVARRPCRDVVIALEKKARHADVQEPYGKLAEKQSSH